MAKQKGHRANKPNDSFGTVNNDNLYRNKYKEDVYKEDEEDNTEDAEQVVSEKETDPSTKEATQSTESFAEKKEPKDVDYKKRYDDLKRHYDQKQEEWKQKVQSVQQQPQDNLNAFKDKYPDVHSAVEEIATNKAESQLAILKEELEHYYRDGKGNPPSSSKILRRYGFKNKRKDKLIKEVERYLSHVDILKGI